MEERKPNELSGGATAAGEAVSEKSAARGSVRP